MSFAELFKVATTWSNANQGILSIAIFIVTIAFGWVSGIFSALRRRPKFQITVNAGPTFCCTFMVGKKHSEYDVHRTAIALYLNVANVGSAPSSIENITVGYHCHLKPFRILWLKYGVGWFWIEHQAIALADFQIMIGENIKVYPFLTQKSFLSESKCETYLEVGRSTTGVVYFEQSDSWGDCFPTVPSNGMVRLKVCIQDVFGLNHYAKFDIPSVSLEVARKYNPAFGKTLAELHGEQLPFDAASNIAVDRGASQAARPSP